MPGGIVIEIETAGFRDAAGHFAKASDEMVAKHILPEAHSIRDTLISASQEEAPYKTGELRGGIYGRTYVELGGVTIKVAIAERVKHRRFVVEGTRPHHIYPVVKKALWWPGALHPVKHVFHPGTRPNPFLDRALQKSMPDVEKAAWRIAARAVEAVTR